MNNDQSDESIGDLIQILNNLNNTTEIQNYTSDKYLYHFDFPELTESGYIEIFPQKIIVHFPDKNVSSKIQNTSNQNSLLYINKKLKFSYDWLPIYTQADLFRIKDMLTKCYYEFYKFKDTTVINEDNNYWPVYHNERIKEYKTPNFNYYCFENSFVSSIELNIPITSSHQNSGPYVQFCIGSNTIFDSQKDILLPPDEYFFIVILILFKLIK